MGQGDLMAVSMTGGPPWGFRLQGGYATYSPLTISKVRRASKADDAGLKEGDEILELNRQSCANMTHEAALNVIDYASVLNMKISRKYTGQQQRVAPYPPLTQQQYPEDDSDGLTKTTRSVKTTTYQYNTPSGIREETEEIETIRERIGEVDVTRTHHSRRTSGADMLTLGFKPGERERWQPPRGNIASKQTILHPKQSDSNRQSYTPPNHGMYESPTYHRPSANESPTYHRPSTNESPTYHRPSTNEPPTYRRPSTTGPPRKLSQSSIATVPLGKEVEVQFALHPSSNTSNNNQCSAPPSNVPVKHENFSPYNSRDSQFRTVSSNNAPQPRPPWGSSKRLETSVDTYDKRTHNKWIPAPADRDYARQTVTDALKSTRLSFGVGEAPPSAPTVQLGSTVEIVIPDYSRPSSAWKDKKVKPAPLKKIIDDPSLIFTEKLDMKPEELQSPKRKWEVGVYDPTLYPSVEKQKEQCKRVALSFFSPLNLNGVGGKMFQKRIKQAEKHTLEGIGMNPEQPREFSDKWTDLDHLKEEAKEEEMQDKMMEDQKKIEIEAAPIYPANIPPPPPPPPDIISFLKGDVPKLPKCSQVFKYKNQKTGEVFTVEPTDFNINLKSVKRCEHNVVTPDVCKDLVESLKSDSGRGSAMFERRKQRSVKWVTDEKNRSQISAGMKEFMKKEAEMGGPVLDTQTPDSKHEIGNIEYKPGFTKLEQLTHKLASQPIKDPVAMAVKSSNLSQYSSFEQGTLLAEALNTAKEKQKNRKFSNVQIKSKTDISPYAERKTKGLPEPDVIKKPSAPMGMPAPFALPGLGSGFKLKSFNAPKVASEGPAGSKRGGTEM